MRYADCYMANDKTGHPSATYLLDVPKKSLEASISQLNKSFDKVVLTNESKGQSPVALSSIITIDAAAPTLQNAMRGARV